MSKILMLFMCVAFMSCTCDNGRYVPVPMDSSYVHVLDTRTGVVMKEYGYEVRYYDLVSAKEWSKDY